ncbi:hypothetical protein Pelo_5347 [Pelomyxa schiedti]|nr:hypothetical protein Pelo_5347 [Pelomyxa schiedti]
MGGSNNKMMQEEAARVRREYCLPQDKLDQVCEGFRKYSGKDGRISRENFRKIVDGVMHQELADKVFFEPFQFFNPLLQVFDSFDRDHSNTMDIHEYLSMMGVTHGGTLEQKLNASFDLFDKNGDGVLSKEEIKEMFVMIVKQKKRALTLARTGSGALTSEPLDAASLAAIDGVVETIFEQADADHNGTLDRGEFIAGFSAHPEVCGFFKQF